MKKTNENNVKEIKVDGGSLYVDDYSVDEFILSMCYDTESMLTVNQLPLIENALTNNKLVKEVRELLLECKRNLLLFDLIKIKKVETYL